MNIIEAIQERCNFLREHVIPEYDKLGLPGVLGAALLRQDVVKAEAVIASGDTTQMIGTLAALRETCERAL